ncbi:MAG: DNRLRE domain-containing protein [Ignavibacteria bacterium]|nr:DNRLRE domain-containing protein [Ignavibacteria bacterium]
MKKIKSLFWLLKLISIVSISLFLISCSENPTITGYNLLNPIDSLIVKRFDSTRDSVWIYHKQLNQHDILGGTRRILVGRYNDLTAHALIRFRIGLSSELRDAVKNNKVSITSARIKMNPVYKFGDTLSNRFGMEIKEVYTFFEEYKFTIDSLKSGRYEIDQDNILTRSIDADTLYYCELDTNKVLGWFQRVALDSSKKLQGILLTPTLTTSYIKGFASSNAYYVGDPIVMEVVAKYNSKTDSLIFYVDADLHVIETSSTIVTLDEKIKLQSGVKTKSFIYFDLTNIPKNAIVNSAFIRLYLDTLSSRFGTSRHDSILVQYITDSTNISIDSAVTFVLSKTTGGYYEGQINYYVQKWIDNNSNKGLLLSTRDPDGGVDEFVFYGPKAAIFEKRPQLIINYSSRK